MKHLFVILVGILLGILLVIGGATAASAQVLTTPQRLARATVSCQGCESPATVLTRHLSRGDVLTLQRYAAELLQTLDKTGPDELRAALGDVRRNYYRLVWLGRSEDSGSQTVQSAVVHVGDENAIRVLPGITTTSSVQLIDVFVSGDAAAVLDTQYVSTPTKDPLSAQIPAFVDRTGVIGLLAGIPLGRGEAELGARNVSTTYSVSRAVLPFARADVKVRDTVVIPGSAAGLRASSAELRDRLSIRDARLSPCAQALSASHAQAITAGLAGESCAIPSNEPSGLNSSGANACRAALGDLLEESYRRSIADCRDPVPGIGFDPVLVVDKEFRDLIASLRDTRRTADSRLVDTPRTRYSFGVLSAAIVGNPRYSASTVRVKISSSGSIVHDPLPTLMNMALVNIHPWPYDAQEDSVTWPERFRLFAGTAFTPDFGIGGGAGVLIVRGLSLNAGWANLFVKRPRAGFAVGDTPKTDSPLTVGGARVLFAGLSYSFR